MIRRALGRRLRDLREGAGKTVDDVITARVASKSTIWRIETGKVAPSVPVIQSLCLLYDVDQELMQSLVALAAGASSQGWWEEYGEVVVPDWFGLYIGLESGADRIRAFQPEVIHGLLQTENYARAVTRGDRALTEEVVERRVAFRMQRAQAVLGGRTELTVILTEGALSLIVGSPTVRAEQLQHLKELSTRPRVNIRFRRHDAGTYPIRGSYTLLDFEDPEDPSVAYVEFPTGARYVEHPRQVGEFARVFEIVSAGSLPVAEYET
jgi:transcriptional regulator with XRE-family HTH domain